MRKLMMATYSTPVTTMKPRCAPRPLLRAKIASITPTGRMQTSEASPTRPMGMSCSVRGKSAPWPAERARCATSAERSPAATGCTSLPSVHTAATPMVPAPTKRTLWLQVSRARWASEAASVRCAMSGVSAEKCGTPHTQEMSRPTSIATPTHSPTRCPTPNSANDRKKSKPETPAPRRKLRTTSLAKRRVAVIRENTPDTTEPHRSADSPALLSSTPVPAVPQPLEHLGAGHPFGVGQVGGGDERAAQRDRVHDPEDAAEQADE